MKHRTLITIAGLVIASASVYGQAGLTGKWQTDNVPAALEAQKNPPAEAAGRGGPQAIMLDLKVDASGKISGTVTEIGNPPVLNIETGMVDGKKITWVTQPRGVTWNLEMTDDNTVTLTGRVFAARPAAAPPADGAVPPAGGPPPSGRGRGRGPQQPIIFHRVQ